MYNVDIFTQSEQDILFFCQGGKIFLAGDRNGRIGIKPDFIPSDRYLHANDIITVDTPMTRIS